MYSSFGPTFLIDIYHDDFPIIFTGMNENLFYVGTSALI